MEESKQSELVDNDIAEDLPYDEDNFGIEHELEYLQLGNFWEEIKNPEAYVPVEWTNIELEFNEGPNELVNGPYNEPIDFWQLYFTNVLIQNIATNTTKYWRHL